MKEPVGSDPNRLFFFGKIKKRGRLEVSLFSLFIRAGGMLRNCFELFV